VRCEWVFIIVVLKQEQNEEIYIKLPELLKLTNITDEYKGV
jgi:hypothetical protein